MNIGRYAVSTDLLGDVYEAMNSIRKIARRIDDPKLNQAMIDLEKAVDVLPKVLTIGVSVEYEKGLNAIAGGGYSGKTMSWGKRYF